jgi:hypothetical protein
VENSAVVWIPGLVRAETPVVAAPIAIQDEKLAPDDSAWARRRVRVLCCEDLLEE